MNSRVAFDKARAANNEKGYTAGMLFNPQSGVFTLILAAYFNPLYIKTLQQVYNRNSSYLNWQLVLYKLKFFWQPATNVTLVTPQNN